MVGRYRILGHIADGGMASVYLAELEGPGTFHKHVALKVIHPHLRRDPAFAKMFGDEALIAARLHHPNIVQTFDLVESGDHLAIAMEYAPGLPVSVLRTGHLIDPEPELVAYIGAEAAAALHYAHTLTDTLGRPLNIVHRDVSSSNVQIGLDCRVRLVDFGIARARDCVTMTTIGMIKGTLAYIAPERFTTGAASPQTDVWSLGVVLWEILARQRLFRHASDADTAAAVLTDEVPALETIRPEVPAALSAIVHQAIEREPAKRWASAAELERALRQHHPARTERLLQPLRASLAPYRQDQFGRVRRLFERQEPQPVTVTASPDVSPPSVGGDTPSPALPSGRLRSILRQAALALGAEGAPPQTSFARWGPRRWGPRIALAIIVMVGTAVLVLWAQSTPEKARAPTSSDTHEAQEQEARRHGPSGADPTDVPGTSVGDTAGDAATREQRQLAGRNDDTPDAAWAPRRSTRPRSRSLTYDSDVYRARSAGGSTPRQREPAPRR